METNSNLHKEWVDLALKASIELGLLTDTVSTCCQMLHRVWRHIEKNNCNIEEFETGNVVCAAILLGMFFCMCL